jgi:SAM-dependent methyltransferase
MVRLSFPNRVIERELLDDLPPEQARNSLADLVRLNRDFGGYSSLQKLLDRATSPDESFSMLDVGSASGDMARRVAELRPRARVTVLDYIPHHLHGAPSPRVAADAFQLPFPAKSFDFVFSSLFLHHFTNERLATMLAGFRAVARRAVLAVDLERRMIPYYFVPATRAFLRWDPITAHDAPVSVAAGFRAAELAQLARAAGFSQADVRTHGFAYRVTLYAPV